MKFMKFDCITFLKVYNLIRFKEIDESFNEILIRFKMRDGS